MTALAPAERRRLVGALALLGSDKPGEVIAAATAAHRMVSDRGLSWDVLLTPTLPSSRGRSDEPGAHSWQANLALLRRHPGDLRVWEREFVTSMASRFTTSPKQRACLSDIAERLRERGRT